MLEAQAGRAPLPFNSSPMSLLRPLPRPQRALLARLAGGLAASALLLLASCSSSRQVAVEGHTFRDNAVSIPPEHRFADLNGEQLASAREFGIAKPLSNRRQARRKTRRMKHVESCGDYLVDPLTHSVPYLTRGAHSLLTDIARAFQYFLAREGYRPHRIIVTSLLRTEDDVASLRRVNGNAARNSSHLYGTSFDLSYTRFNRLSTQGRPVSNQEMACILATVIAAYREQGDCVAIYERNQHCFHITARRK